MEPDAILTAPVEKTGEPSGRPNWVRMPVVGYNSVERYVDVCMVKCLVNESSSYHIGDRSIIEKSL
jgi:hypothetical protein